MEVTLSPEQEAQLQRIARRTGRNSEALAQEAIGHLLEHEERFIEAVEKGLASLNRGDFISHQEVKRRIESLLESRWRCGGRPKRLRITYPFSKKIREFG